MTRIVAAGIAAIVASSQLVSASDAQVQTTYRPGVGVGSVGIPAPMVSAPAVTAKTVKSNAAASTPGASAPTITSNQNVSSPGMTAQNMSSRDMASQPGIASRAPATPSLPQGYFTSIPATTNIVDYKGFQCYYVGGKYYRAEYYMGSLVYVLVP
jgi:hypothetical protein